MQNQRPQIQNGTYLNENVGEDNEDREGAARRFTITPGKKLRHRVKTVAQVKGQENPKQGVKSDQHRSPADVHRNEALGVRSSHHSDKVMTADIRRDDARANHPPGETVASQEIIAL